MIVEIKGVQFVNKGAELMLHAVLQQMAKLYPDAELALLPGPNSPYKKRAMLGALQIAPLQFYSADLNWLVTLLPSFVRRKLRQWFGIVFQCDIDLVLDASGFAYGDRWGRFGVKFLAANTRLVHKNQGHYVLLPQAFGPFTAASDQALLRQAVANSALVFARDAESLNYLKTAGCDESKLRQAPDFTNLLNAPLLNDERAKQFFALLIPNYQMIKGKTATDIQQYKQLMIRYVSLCRGKGWLVLILNHEGDIDQSLCIELKNQFQHDEMVSVLQPDDPLVVKAWIGHAGLVFSSRFHGCVSALSQAVPCIGTSWSHKYQHLYADYACTQWLVGLDSADAELEKLIAQCSSDELKNSLRQHSAKLQELATNMWLEVADKTSVHA